MKNEIKYKPMSMKDRKEEAGKPGFYVKHEQKDMHLLKGFD